MGMSAGVQTTRYCKTCGLGPREWQECEEVDCSIETQLEGDMRAARRQALATTPGDKR